MSAMTLSTATLDEGAALIAAATPGPFVFGRDRYRKVIYAKDGRYYLLRMNEAANWREDADALVWLHTHAADLIAAARQAQDNAKELGALRDGYDTMSRALDAAPGLPLECCSPQELEQWTTAICAVLMNIGVQQAAGGIAAAITAATPGKGAK